MNACKNLAIDIRKVRDLTQSNIAHTEAQPLSGQLASHVAAMIDASKEGIYLYFLIWIESGEGEGRANSSFGLFRFAPFRPFCASLEFFLFFLFFFLSFFFPFSKHYFNSRGHEYFRCGSAGQDARRGDASTLAARCSRRLNSLFFFRSHSLSPLSPFLTFFFPSPILLFASSFFLAIERNEKFKFTPWFCRSTFSISRFPHLLVMRWFRRYFFRFFFYYK